MITCPKCQSNHIKISGETTIMYEYVQYSSGNLVETRYKDIGGEYPEFYECLDCDYQFDFADLEE